VVPSSGGLGLLCKVAQRPSWACRFLFVFFCLFVLRGHQIPWQSDRRKDERCGSRAATDLTGIGSEPGENEIMGWVQKKHQRKTRSEHVSPLLPYSSFQSSFAIAIFFQRWICEVHNGPDEVPKEGKCLLELFPSPLYNPTR